MFRKYLRVTILSYLFLKAGVRILDVLSPVEYFLPLTIYLLNTPTITIWRVTFGIDFVFLVILFSTIVGDYRQQMGYIDKIVAFIFGLTGIALYFISPEITSYFIRIIFLSIVSIILLSAWYSAEESIKIVSAYMGITVLLALTVGLLRSWRWLPEIVFAGIGVFEIFKHILHDSKISDVRPGLDAILFQSVVEIGKSPNGIAAGNLIYIGLFSNIAGTVLVFSFLIQAFLGSPLSADPRSLFMNIGSILGMTFMGLFLAHWVSLLMRIPYSVLYWNSSYNNYYYLTKGAKNRPLIRGMFLPVFGIFLSRIPTWEVDRLGPYRAFQEWQTIGIIIYLLVVFTVFIYSIVSVPQLRPVRFSLPFSSWLVSDQPEIKKDSITYISSGILLIAMHLVFLDFSTIPVVLLSIMFFRFDTSNSVEGFQVWMIVGLGLLILISRLSLFSQTANYLLYVLTTFWVVYGLRLISENIAWILENYSKI